MDMEDKKSMKTLLVIGNGFDLALGMRSTFKEFGLLRCEELQRGSIFNWTLLDLILEEDSIGFWGREDTFVNSSRYQTWNDFESFFKEHLVNALKHNDIFENVSDYDRKHSKDPDGNYSNSEMAERNMLKTIVTTLAKNGYIYRIKNSFGKFVVDDRKLQETDTDQWIGSFVCELLLVRRVRQYFQKSSINPGMFSDSRFYFESDLSGYEVEKITEENISADEISELSDTFWISLYDLTPLILEDLRIWEQDFSSFIEKRQFTLSLYENYDYDTAASKFITEMLSENEQDMQQEVQLLNFNYSKPDLGNVEDVTFDKQLNIHGSIKAAAAVPSKVSGIVIGFDFNTIFETEIFRADLLAPFTKTFRISELNTILAKEWPGYLSTRLDYRVDKIVIVGHSLSEADDSYFRTIFDTANLYNGNVVLEYWYTDFPGRDARLSVETESLQTINGLLSRYIKEANIPNVTNKNNLLHKLLLENRLLLREYDINKILDSSRG